MFKKMFKKVAVPVVSAGGAVVATVTNAHAAVDISGVNASFDLTTITALAGIIVVALGALWGIRRLLSFVRR